MREAYQEKVAAHLKDLSTKLAALREDELLRFLLWRLFPWITRQGIHS